MTAPLKNKRVNRAWINEHVNDPYVRLATKEGFRARAAYKLKEIDETLGLIKPGQVVVDLGAAPGAWSQYVRRRFAPAGAGMGALPGVIIALDLLDFEPVEGVDFIQGDFHDDAVLQVLEHRLGGRPVDVVLSDMAPNLSGIASTDGARVAALVESAVDFALRHLRQEGALVCKCFHGSGYDDLVRLFKASFRIAKPFKPKASRDKSAETFLVGIGPKS
jgi:23S rRNA (uridine2552-2'-O)-methyltransferase